MFNFIIKYYNIYSLSKIKDDYYVVNKNKELLILDSNLIHKSKVQLENNEKYFFKFEETTYFLTDINNLGVFKNNRSRLIINDIKVRDIIKKDFDCFIVFYYGKIRDKTYGIYNIKTNKILWSEKNRPIINLDNKIFYFQNNILSRLKIINGEIIWQQNLSERFQGLKISRFIGVCESVLVIGLGTSNDVDNYVIGINIDTGDVIWNVKTGAINHLIIDKEAYKLRGIISKYYFEIDISNGYFNKIQFSKNDYSFDSQRTNFVQVDNHIITTDYRKGKIGAFNTKTHRFDWLHEERGVSFPGGSPMLYKKPYLFVQDNKQTVHVFKKENVNNNESV